MGGARSIESDMQFVHGPDWRQALQRQEEEEAGGAGTDRDQPASRAPSAKAVRAASAESAAQSRTDQEDQPTLNPESRQSERPSEAFSVRRK